MNEKIEPLWLHAYTGRENGLMIVGSPREIRALAQQLLTAADDFVVTNEKWPVQIAAPQTTGPYRDVQGYTLSFHLSETVRLQETLPFGRRNMPAPVTIAIGICAIAGILSIGRWIGVLLS